MASETVAVATAAALDGATALAIAVIEIAPLLASVTDAAPLVTEAN